MPDPQMMIFAGLVLLTYTSLVIVRKHDAWMVWAIAFVGASFCLRHSIDVSAVRDFAPYYNSLLKVKYGEVPTELYFEPYRMVIFQIIILVGGLSDQTQIAAVYYIHFFIVTAFFLWLSRRPNITFELKLILFLGFYATISFVWLRAGMGYIASCFLMIKFAEGKWRGIKFALPLFHASTIPLVLARTIENYRLHFKVIIILVAAAGAFVLLETGYAQYLTYKIERYAETSAKRDSFNLLLFNLANIAVFFYFAATSRRFRTNFIVLVLMATTLLVYFVSPIMGVRMFPFVLIAAIIQGIPFRRFKALSVVICLGYVPIYFARFDQILS